MEGEIKVFKFMEEYLIAGLNPGIDHPLSKIEDVIKGLRNYSKDHPNTINWIRQGYGLHPKDIEELNKLGYPILPPSYL